MAIPGGIQPDHTGTADAAVIVTANERTAPMTATDTTRPKRRPTHGWTRLGFPVHAKTIDHLPTGNAYERFNKRMALAITRGVGTMTTFWIFCILALLSLPAVLSGFSAFRGVFPGWLIKASIIALIAWIAQTFIQLVLLPALMVGQNLQNDAADARAGKTFEDVEDLKKSTVILIDRLDCRTEGGISDLRDELIAYIDKKFPSSVSPTA
jgi:hypothetical protein